MKEKPSPNFPCLFMTLKSTSGRASPQKEHSIKPLGQLTPILFRLGKSPIYLKGKRHSQPSFKPHYVSLHCFMQDWRVLIRASESKFQRQPKPRTCKIPWRKWHQIDEEIQVPLRKWHRIDEEIPSVIEAPMALHAPLNMQLLLKAYSFQLIINIYYLH